MHRYGCILLLSLQESGCFPKYMQECVMYAYLIITVISFGKKRKKESPLNLHIKNVTPTFAPAFEREWFKST